MANALDTFPSNDDSRDDDLDDRTDIDPGVKKGATAVTTATPPPKGKSPVRTVAAGSTANGFGPTLRAVATTGRKRPNRAILYAVESWGKSSLACEFPKPVVLMTPGEDGLRTLLDNGLVPETAHFDQEAKSWSEVLSAVRELSVTPDHGFKTFVLDTLNGAARLCVEYVTEREFQGSATKFSDFGRGWKSVPSEWAKLMAALTELNGKGVSILLLAHSRVETFKNPEGTDYDRYAARMPHNSMWELAQEWADMVLFGQLETFVQADGMKAKKGKASGGQNRLLYCQKTAVADAKNRHGLPPIIECGESPQDAWAALAAAIVAGRRQPVTAGDTK